MSSIGMPCSRGDIAATLSPGRQRDGHVDGRALRRTKMQDSLLESRDTASDDGAPTFLARKGIMLREYHVVALWPDGRREKIGRFPRRPDAARWIAQKSTEWLAEHFARVEDERIGIRPTDGATSSSTA
jgi:hypothetical protein